MNVTHESNVLYPNIVNPPTFRSKFIVFEMQE